MQYIILGSLLSTIIGSVIYLANRFGVFFQTFDMKYNYMLFSAVILFSSVGGIALVNSISKIGSITYILASVLLGFLLYLLLSTILIDVINLAIKLKPIQQGIFTLLLAIIVSTYGIWNAYNLKITEISIPINGLERSVKALHLTDTHIGHFRGASNLQKIVDEINNQNVDVVFFTGDLLDSRIQLNPESMDPLRSLNAPIYFVEGNHDLYTGVDSIKSYLNEIGVNVLQNEITRWNELQIIGLNHMLADGNSFDMHAAQNGKTVQSVLAELQIDKNIPTVLLHHGPSGIKYAEKAGVDLYLAGHTHGGQLWPFTIFSNYIFEVNRGFHKFSTTNVYVSEGTGTFGPPMRIGTKSEMTVINLIPGN